MTEPARPPRRMMVPVPLPEGTRWEGFFGDDEGEVADRFGLQLQRETLKEAKQVANYAFAARPQAVERLSLAKQPAAGRSVMLRTESLSRLGRARPQPAAPMPMAGGVAVGQRGYFGNGRGGARGTSGGVGGAFGGSGGGGFGGGGLGSVADTRRSKLAAAQGLPQLQAAAAKEAGAIEATAEALIPQAGAMQKVAQDAQQALAAIKEQKPEDFAALRQALVRVYFLDLAAANFGASDGTAAATALEELESLHEKQVAQWSKDLPQLDNKLDLVLRDKTIDEALAEIARAAGIKIELQTGSVEDASSLLEETPRVTYLDLRRATVAQALDWILQPARITWSPAKGGIVAATDRRREGASGWIYDVADIALPLASEFEGLNDQQKLVEASRKAAEEFLDAARKELKGAGQLVVWYAPGELLVLGHPATHEKAAKLLSGWRSPGAKQEGSISDKAFKRLTARREQIEKAREARAQLAVAAAHHQFGWQLLAAAAGGKLDDEALTELGIAWRDPATEQMLAGDSAGLVLRSLWAIAEAARLLPQERKLATLAGQSLETSQEARRRALKALAANPPDEARRLTVLYAALAAPDDANYRTEALPLFKDSNEQAGNLTGVVARVLLGEASKEDRRALEQISPEQVQGADSVALAALACHRAGGKAWAAFRAASPTIVGGQPLPGEVVVLVNQLSPVLGPVSQR